MSPVPPPADGLCPRSQVGRPNILLILTDQQRFDTISARVNSFEVNTPGIDSLVGRGVSFDRAFCTSPICGPARASIMTGLYPTQASVDANLGPNCGPLRGSIVTVGHRMQALGYETVYHGKWHLGGDPARYGFEKALETGHDPTAVHAACRLYRERDWVSTKRPFFQVVSLLNPHDVYFLEPGIERPVELPPWANRDDDLTGKPWPQSLMPGRGWSAERFEYYRRFYAGKVEKADRLIVELLDELTCGGYASNTFVIFSSDHGDMAGEHGMAFKGPVMYDGVMRVPLVVCPPRHGVLGSSPCPEAWRGFTPGRRGELVSHLDLIPTILDMAGAAADPALPGRSLLPALQGRPFTGHDAVLGEWREAGPHRTPIRMAREQWWKYTHYIGVGEELYDLERDPAEVANLAADPAHAAELDRLRGRVKEHCRTTDDPFFTMTPTDRPASPHP